MVAAEVTSQIRWHAILQRPMTMALIPWSLELCPAARQSAPAAGAWILEVWSFPLTRYRRYRQGPLDHPFRDRIPRQPRNVMNAQTLHQLGPVCFHGLYTDFQQMSDGLGAVAVANQPQDLPLAGCEGLCGDGFLGSEGPLHDLSANGGRQIVSASNDTLYGEV